MDKLLSRKWVILLLSIVLLSISCRDKEYDFDKFDDDCVIPDVPLGFPLGTLRYTAMQIADKADLNHDLVVEGDTMFLRYYTELDFLAEPGNENYGNQSISVFKDVSDGSILYFSNPVFNCMVKNSGNIPATFDLNHVTGTKEGFPDISLEKPYAIPVAANQTVTQRFDRINGETHKMFRIGDPETGVGPDIMIYSFSHTAQSNADIFADMTVKLPLSFEQGSKIVFKDTLLMDLTAYKEDSQDIEKYFESAVITLEYTNKMPVGGMAEFIFLNKDNMPVAGLKTHSSRLNTAELKEVQMQGFKSNITQKETKGSIDIKFDKSEWKAAQNIASMVIKTTMGNPNKNIHFLPDDFMKFKVKFFINGNIIL